MGLSLESIFIIVIGLLLCFAGWWLFRISTFSMGLILGASMGYTLAVLVLKTGQIPLPDSWAPWVIILVTIIFGLLGILLIKTIIKILLFIAGFLFGMVLIALYSGGQGATMQPYSIKLLIENLSIWSVALGLVFGILFVLFQKGFVIIYTCAVGAYLVTSYMEAPPMVFYGLLFIGTIVQFWMSKGSTVKNMKIAKAGKGR